jgi:acetyl esterase/lipase
VNERCGPTPSCFAFVRSAVVPIGYLWTVALVSWGVACALTRWHWAGWSAMLPALLVSELPFLAGYLLIASTALALVNGDLDSPVGVAGAAVALLALVGLAVLVRRSLRAHVALRNVGRPRRPWARILRAPFLPGRRDVVRVRDLAYGDGPRHRLDVYHRRDRPAGAPVLVHLHGGGFHSGDKGREARPLIRHLASRRGFVCVAANYRLQPRATLADQVRDVRAALAWVREHAAEYGGDSARLFVTGSSAGAFLAVRAACDGETGIAGLICRYGYYGELAPGADVDVPPTLVVHGKKDILVPAAHARGFAQRLRAASHPVIYAELPGAHHTFDLFESIRSAAVCAAVEEFASSIEEVDSWSRWS